MVRPDADIPQALNGRVKDIRDNTDMTLHETYYEVILRGVQDLEETVLEDDALSALDKQRIREMRGKP